MDFDELKKHIKIIVQIYKKNERDPYMALWIRRLMMIILLVSAFMVYALGMTKAVLVIAVAFVFYAVCEIFSEKNTCRLLMCLQQAQYLQPAWSCFLLDGLGRFLLSGP